MQTLRYIAIHHSGGTLANPLVKSSSLTYEEINEAHRLRWPGFPSSIVLKGKPTYVGYNFLIFPNGERVQTRALGEETAAQYGFNLNTISICLVGNFAPGVEMPTKAQIIRLRALLLALITRDYTGLVVLQGTAFDLNISRMQPHRFFQPTECYGHGLPDTWGRDQGRNAIEERLGILQHILLLYQQLLARMKLLPLAGDTKLCAEVEARG